VHALGDHDRGLELYEAALLHTEEPAPILRELVDTALSAGRRDVAMSALARLLDEPLEADERGVLRHAHYRLLSSELVDTKSADDSLSRSLESAESAAWAAEEARVRAIESDDGALRVKAHRRLASDAKDPAVRTAHLATAARAAALADDAQTAISLLREALETAGSHPYLSNLLAVLLERQGDSAEAVRVLRNAAPASASAADTEHTLLRAARTAERAGQLEAARASYRDCVGAHPGSVGASWMLGRFAERTHDGDAALLAHESLARAEVDAGVPGVETLLLGEHLAFGREEPALAVDALRAVLDADDTAPHAALALALLDVGALEPDMRDATARGLVAAASAAALPGVLRYAAREARDGATTEQRETLARAARELDPQEAWPGLAELLGPGEPDPRTFQRLAATEDEGIAADFRLAGERLLALRGTPPDTTSTALDAIDSFTHACLVLESRTGATPEMEAAALAFVRDATHVSGQRDVDHALARAHLA
ncbi:MAG: hypothetical protein KC417_16605, partial [Myxococcales bacterium]|nr:hypothetical protein [Myxococcales bacterium]